MPLSSDQFTEFKIRLKNDLPSQVIAVECDEDPDGQVTIAVEIKDSSWQSYVMGICRTHLRSLLDDPYSVSLLIVPVTDIGNTEGLFGLTFRGGINTFFIHYYAPERLRSKPFTVPVYYRKLIDALRIIPTEKGFTLESAEIIWKRLFSTSYEALAKQQGISTFTVKNLAGQLRQFLIGAVDEIKEIAETRGDHITIVTPFQHHPSKTVPIDIARKGKRYQIASSIPAIVWVSPFLIGERIDAHPFQPAFIEIDELLSDRDDCAHLEEKLQRGRGITGGATPLGANYLPNGQGIRFIRTQDITPNWIDLSDIVNISLDDHETLRRSALEVDDVLLTITGALFGQSAVVYPECLPANISQHLVKMHFSNDVNPRYVATYLNSKYGQSQIQMHRVGTTRSALDYDGVKALRIPLPDRRIQDYIGEKIYLAEQCKLKARSLWNISQEILSDALQLSLTADFFEDSGIEEMQSQLYWLIDKNPVSVWVHNGLLEHKLGPQYFHPRRVKVLSKLQSTGVQLDQLSKIASRQSDRKHEQGTANFPYLGLADIDGQTGYFDPDTLTRSAEAEAVRIFRKGDVLISRLRPNLNKVSVCPPYLDEAGGSTELMVYRPKRQIPAFYVFYVVKSKLVLHQIVDVTVGSTLPRVEPDVIDDILIPRIGNERENRIDEEVRRMFWFLYRASNLIKQATSDVFALFEEQLDISSIVDGHLRPPSWDDVLHDVETSLAT